MNIHIRSRTGKVRDDHRALIEAKLRKLERYTDGNSDVLVELARIQGRSTGETHVVQATLHMPQGTIVRAEERQPDLQAAVDTLHDTLQRQLTRYKDKHFRRGKTRATNGTVPTADELAAPDVDTQGQADGAQLVRTKRFAYKPMTSDEAIEQMELLGHTFFVFTDASTNQVNVVYRRRDGNYGVIVPETV
jgi:ribosomal subunit interface protein